MKSNNSTRSREAMCLLAGILATAASALGQSTDRIRTSGSSKTGEVVRMSPTEVAIERGGTTTDVPVLEINSILFRDEPAELTQARLNATNGGYESALSRLEAINRQAVSREFIEQDIAYYEAFCNAKLALVGGKDIRRAGQALNAFVTEYPDSYHFLEGTELLGDLLTRMGNYSAAEGMYRKLAGAPWPAYKMRSSVLVGKALLEQEKFAEALGQFEAALAVTDNSKSGKQQRLAAQLGKAVALAATGQVQSGLEAVEQVIRDGDPSNAELLAQAYNALGACYLQAGQPKRALYAYLHTDLLYSGVAQQHAEALAELIPLWQSVGQDGEARRAKATLLEKYPASRWAKEVGA